MNSRGNRLILFSEHFTGEAEEDKKAEEAEAAAEAAGGGGDDGSMGGRGWSPNEDGYSETIAIIGGGPAGLAAAIYAARAGLKPVVISPPVGGQLKGKPTRAFHSNTNRQPRPPTKECLSFATTIAGCASTGTHHCGVC